MAEDQRLGAVYWIDHFVYPTSDLERWLRFTTDVLGCEAQEPFQIHTPDRHGNRLRGAFTKFHECFLGAFMQPDEPPLAGVPGTSTPRYGFYVRAEDLDEHLRRLDASGAPHSEAMRTSAEGEDGTAVFWQDPDGNEYEFWAPTALPPAAMDGAGPLKIGRVCSGTFGSRDPQASADFFSRYCGLDRIFSADIPNDTVAMRLLGGGRLIFKKVDRVDPRAATVGPWQGVHGALVIRAEEFFPAYEKIWADLPELPLYEEDQAAMPPHSAVHGSLQGRRFKTIYGRGDAFVDGNCNLFHFVGGEPIDGSMARYKGRFMDEYIEEYLAAHPEAATNPKG